MKSISTRAVSIILTATLYYASSTGTLRADPYWGDPTIPFENADVTAAHLDSDGSVGQQYYSVMNDGLTNPNFSSSIDAFIGNTHAYNHLNISAGSRLVSKLGYIGYSSASVYNTVTLSGTGPTDTNTRWTTNGDLFVGYDGDNNTLTLENGADVNTSYQAFYIGYSASSSGNTVVVDDSGSALEAGSIYVGYHGIDSLLTVTGGADIYANSGTTIGEGAGLDFAQGRGILSVDGSGSTATLSTLRIGNLGSGSLEISGGASVSSSLTHIGYGVEGSDDFAFNNQASVSGSGSTWTISPSQIFYIGYYADSNDLAISSGGSVTSGNLYLAYDDSSSGNTVTITGIGPGDDATKFTMAELHLGYGGSDNSLSIYNGGEVSSTSTVVGELSTSTDNSILIDGAGSLWRSTGNVSYGKAGNSCAMTISGGADAITGGSFNLGYDGTSHSNVIIVDGSGSTWTNSSDSTLIGRLGNQNTLTISNDAEVMLSTLYIGMGQSSSSNSYGYENKVNVSGGSVLNTGSAGVVVGQYGDRNELNISGGSAVTSGNAYIGYYITAEDNAVTMTGTGAADTGTRWTLSGNLHVGYSGDGGSLDIFAGADLSDVNGYIGNNSYDSAGNTVTIGGSGSTWINSGNLAVGNTSNTGNVLTISDGALVKVGGALTINHDADSANLIYMSDAFLALNGNITSTGTNTIEGLLSGVLVDNGAGGWASASLGINIFATYYTSDAAAFSATGYNDLGGYTVINAVPEPSTYALFGGIAALAFSLYRRRGKRK
ncbi:MAG: PEP-CTERM sorting domain-containing protein [Opitutales bacterium]|jgi:T5SS/PEP-CTERM-associated repeat protein